jgi:hypothetical protein
MCDWCDVLWMKISTKSSFLPLNSSTPFYPRGPTRLKSRTLDSEINRNQTRNQEITRNQWILKSEITKSSLLLSPQSYTAVTHRNQEIRLEIRIMLEITLEIEKSHYKSTEIRLEINRNQIRNQEIRLEITWFRNLVRFMRPCRT